MAIQGWLTRVALSGALLALALTPTVRADQIDDMISPVSMPTSNEDPRVTTEVRPIYLYHRLPHSFITKGGDLHATAVQARIAITDRIGFIATKDGYIWLRPKEILGNEDGWANLAFGFKGVLFEDEESASIVSAGLRYETPWGNRDVQGHGDGVLNPFLSAAQGIEHLHLQVYTGPRLAISGEDSSFWDSALHIDYKFASFYALWETNWVYVLDGGRRRPGIDDEGFDLINFGSSDADGNSIVTMAFGGRYRICEWVDIGATGELPVTGTKDVWDWRVTADVIIRPFGWKLPWSS